jgi:8-oxo-dGTP diphosphatase
MAERGSAGKRRHIVSVDVVVITVQGGRLTVMLRGVGKRRARERWELPWELLGASETLDAAAARLARATLGSAPALIEQVGAVGDGRRHPADAALSVVSVALAVAGTPAPVGGAVAWFPVEELPALAPRHATMIDAALRHVRARLDTSPVAFRLLPPLFTLTELQEIYELLLGQPLHKASFRRALQGAYLVEPTDEWRSEGRGRPAQLFRFAPARRRGTRRGVRFDLP